MYELILFSILPLTSIVLLLLDDNKKERKQLMNGLIITNSIFFLSPILYAFFNTPFGENIFSTNSGGGSVLWLYIFVLPISIVAQLVLIVLKLIYTPTTK